MSNQNPNSGSQVIRRVYVDVEVSPDVVLSWRVGFKINLNPDCIVKERAIICICWSWNDESKVHSLRWDKHQCDKAMLTAFCAAIKDADEIVGHNLGRFDWPWIKTRCLFHGLPPLPAIPVSDTLVMARRQFYFNSNKLDYIARFLGIGAKLHTGFDLWKAIVLDHCPKALTRMVIYCMKDVKLLKAVWRRLSEVAPVKTHAGVLQGSAKWTCPRTGSTNVKVSKTRVTTKGGLTYQMVNNETGSYYTIGTVAHRAYLKDTAPKRLKPVSL